jgi:UDP-N-acetyl-D-mannosaminuronic acid dehydrogenase
MKTICVLGLGYIGLPTASLFATHGHRVLGVDINNKIVDTINAGEIHIEEPGLYALARAAVGSGNLRAGRKPEPSDVYIICVPTPLTAGKACDLHYVVDATSSIVPLLKKGDLVILESTSPPGTTRDILAPMIAKTGMLVGTEIHLAHCPERVLPGRILKELIENPRIIGGITPESARITRELYSGIVEGPIYLTDCTTAELAKIMENTYRDVNIALANELSHICEKLGVSAWEVIELANKHPRVDLHRPGPGVGGHCISVDPWFLVDKFPDEARIISLARDTNDSQPQRVVEQAMKALADVGERNPRVALFGVSYKGNIDDIRESPALEIIAGLKDKVELRVYDPHVKGGVGHEMCSLEDAVNGADLLLIVTDHSDFRFLSPDEMARRMRNRVLFDTRNFLDAESFRRAGFVVHTLGSGKSTAESPVSG